MKTLLLILSLILFSNTSFAEWKSVSFSNDAITYVDTARIKKRGGFVYFWELVDVVDTKKITLFKSFRAYNKADCFDLSYTALQTEYFKTHMAKGTSFQSAGQQKKKYATPNSVMERAINYVCKVAN